MSHKEQLTVTNVGTSGLPAGATLEVQVFDLPTATATQTSPAAGVPVYVGDTVTAHAAGTVDADAVPGKLSATLNGAPIAIAADGTVTWKAS